MLRGCVIGSEHTTLTQQLGNTVQWLTRPLVRTPFLFCATWWVQKTKKRHSLPLQQGHLNIVLRANLTWLLLSSRLLSHRVVDSACRTGATASPCNPATPTPWHQANGLTIQSCQVRMLTRQLQLLLTSFTMHNRWCKPISHVCLELTQPAAAEVCTTQEL